MADVERGFCEEPDTQTYQPVWLRRREIHSSERRKPSEISLRLRLVLSSYGGPSRPRAEVLSLLAYVYEAHVIFGHDQQRLDPVTPTLD